MSLPNNIADAGRKLRKGLNQVGLGLKQVLTYERNARPNRTLN